MPPKPKKWSCRQKHAFFICALVIKTQSHDYYKQMAQHPQNIENIQLSFWQTYITGQFGVSIYGVELL